MGDAVLSNYEIRQARQGDIDNMLEIFAEEVRAGRMLPRNPERVKEDIVNWRVAIKDEAIIGCVSLVFFSDTLGEIRSLAVAPQYRGNGVAKQLISSALELAKEQQLEKVLTLTRSAGLFEGLGFERDLVQKYPEKVWRDCKPCPFIDHCDEIALIYSIEY